MAWCCSFLLVEAAGGAKTAIASFFAAAHQGARRRKPGQTMRDLSGANCYLIGVICRRKLAPPTQNPAHTHSPFFFSLLHPLFTKHFLLFRTRAQI
ncbi:hypothetical protein GQ54DRAFT_106900 [Martensiomyces pterosporus]|nr:hypothetical protein GQ54DRAFT_106900 [Martensiomyces pterosporus]